ncbi:MAG TPA: helix-turn-helix domain-containing protein [Terracidiphilus sp.]|nr:helix-turn-helix domain-containing protein [Terracidiphilus sp.]
MTKSAGAAHTLSYLQPAPYLKNFVRCYAQRSACIADGLLVHPVHARVAPILEFIFGDRIVFAQCDGKPSRTSPSSALIGMQTHRRGELHIRGTHDSFIILFQPAALERLFALPAREFTDSDFDAQSVLGPQIPLLQERLAECRSAEQRAFIADRFLLKRALAAGSLDGVTVAANQIVRAAGRVRLSAMADRAGLSLRQFERRFVSQVGMSPKLVGQIARFEATLDRMARCTGTSWTEIAHRFGYYDQMHMVHEFAEFTRSTPTNTLHNLESLFHQQIEESRSHPPPVSTTGERWIL